MNKDLSVIIVSYNVKHFIEQCIRSVIAASEGLSVEIIVIDNNSTDGSVQVIKSLFKQVILIENSENIGFGKANNQALKIAKGKYILFLNPDTIVANDCFKICFDHMEKHSETGACGGKHLNAQGEYLPESKRGLPTPWVSFCKLTGLTRLFPKSKTFAAYYLGHLSNCDVQNIEVLSGAFMFIRHDLLKKIGGFDERYFMYGEDIDLSYEITKLGFKLQYLPQALLLHYKGESTRKNTIKHIQTFYGAMSLFADKHFSNQYKVSFGWAVKLAILIKSFFMILKKAFFSIGIPLIDALIIFVGYYFLKNYWAEKSGVYYPYEFIRIAIPCYIAIWLFFTWMSGGYDKPYRFYRIVRGVASGTLFILLVYALLPEAYRYSRFLLLLGAVLTITILFCSKLILNRLLFSTFFPYEGASNRILVLSDQTDYQQIINLLNAKKQYPEFIDLLHDFQLSMITLLKERIQLFKISELIVSAKITDYKTYLLLIEELAPFRLTFRLYQPENQFLISKSEIIDSHNWISNSGNILNTTSKRKKRIFDLIVSVTLVLLSPFFFWSTQFRKLLLSVFQVALGQKTWVGFLSTQSSISQLKPSVIQHIQTKNLNLSEELIRKLDLEYAKNYKVINDIGALWNFIKIKNPLKFN